MVQFTARAGVYKRMEGKEKGLSDLQTHVNAHWEGTKAQRKAQQEGKRTANYALLGYSSSLQSDQTFPASKRFFLNVRKPKLTATRVFRQLHRQTLTAADVKPADLRPWTLLSSHD